jgi:hypothetical protein
VVDEALFDPDVTAVNLSENSPRWRSSAAMNFFPMRMQVPEVIAVAAAIHTGCPARHPSPAKSPGPRMATTASFPCRGRDRQLDAALQDIENRACGVTLREKSVVLQA